MEAFSVLGSTFGTPSQSGVFSVLGSTFGTPSQSDLNAIAIQCNLLQLEETPTTFELPSVLGGTFSSPNITTDLSYFPSYNNVIPDISLEQKSNESNSVVNFMIPRVYTTKEYSFEKAFEDSTVNTTTDFEISNSVPVKKCKNIKPRFGLRKYKISTAQEDYFQDTFVSSSDESGKTKNSKRYIKLKNNRKASVHKDFQVACASSIYGSDICKNNEYSRESKNSSISNAQREDFQADFASSSVEESEVRKNSKCRGSKNRNKLNATKINFPNSFTSLVQSKVESRYQQVDKTNPISEVALHKTNSKDEEKVPEIISISKLNSASENDYQTNNEVEEEEKEKVPEIISLTMINNSSEDSDDEYLANIASNKSLKSATFITSNNSQIQLGSSHGSNKRKESFQSNNSKSIPQLELNYIEPKLDKTKLIPKPSFEAATISFDCATVNHRDYKEKKVSETISTSKLNNDFENSEDDYQTNTEEEVSEIISLSKMHNSSEDSDDEYLANIASNKSLKSATLITSIISEGQSGSCHGSNKRKESFQSNISKSIPQLELNSIEPKLDKTKLIPKPSFEAATISFDCATVNHRDYKEKKVSETISTSKLNNDSENSEDDYQTNTEEEVSEIISLSTIHNSSEDSDDEYLANITSNKSLKSATFIASNNSQIQLGSNHGSNKRKESFQSNNSKSFPQLELISIEPKLDKTKLIPKPSFEAASISFDCATVNHRDYKEKKVSETISTSKLKNDSENSEDDYQTNTEEEVSEIISLSKMHNSSEDSDDEYLANIASNKSLKSATLITSIISEGQSGSCHGRKKRRFQTNIMKSNPQFELNSTYNIVPFRESREELTGSLNIDVYSEINGSKNVNRILTKNSAFRNLDRLNNVSPSNLNNEISHLMLSTSFLPEMNNSLISVLQSCRSNVDSAQTVTTLDEFPNRHSKETEETLNFIREFKEINYNSKQPLKTFNRIEIHNFAQNCPFSELRPNQNNKPTVPENEATSNQVLQKDKIKAAAKVLKPSLPKSLRRRPKKWVTKRLYNFLQKKLLSNYGIRYRLEAQKLVMFMVEKVTEALNKTEDYDVPVEKLKLELARKKIIETNRDFFNFVKEFLVRDFYLKSVPNSTPTLQKQIINFTPETIDDKILQS